MKKKPATTNTNQLGNILARYKNRFKPPQSSVEKIVIEAVGHTTGFTLKKEQVTYTVSTKTITLAVPSVMKSEIKAKQFEVQQFLKEKLPASDVPVLII